MIKVLIVDDKPENLYLLQAMLDINGFKTVAAKNGVEALGLMRNDPPDFIISDILMPVMDGFTLCHECKKDKKLKNIPFVFYTATYTDPKDEEYALSLGADLFILKPQEPEDFVKKIERILNDVKKSKFKSKKVRLLPKSVILKEYNETLIRKLEDKMVQTARAEKELLEKEKRLISLYENVNEIIFFLDIEAEDKYRFQVVNTAFLKATGLKEDQVVGKLVNEVIPEPSLSLVLANYRKAIKDRKSVQWEEVTEYPSGKKTGHVTITPIFDEQGTCSYLVGTVYDITERVMAFVNLEKSKKNLEDYFENDISADYLVSADGEIFSCNRTFLEMFGFKDRSQAEKFNITQLYKNPDDRKELIRKVKESGKVENYEVDFRAMNSMIINAIVNAVGIFNDSGDLIQIRGYIVDITARKNAEDEVRQNEQRWKELLESLPQLVWTCRVDGPCDYLSPKWISYTGIPEEEQLGYGWLNQLHPDDRDRTIAEWMEKVKTGENFNIEFRIRRYDGVYRWFETIAIPLTDSDGKIIKWFGSNTDFDDLIKAKEKAEESDRLKTAFLHNVSHEIRTPLNAIIGFSSFLDQPDLTTEDRKNFIDIIFQSNNQLLSIVNDILNISYIEADQVKIKKSRTDIKMIMDNLYHQYLIEAQKKNLSFDMKNEINSSDAFIETDESKLIQTISNLLNNAFKFTREGHVVLGCRIESNKLIAWVEDTGIGIPERDQARIFERFYQVDKTESRIYGGTGLGLSISEGFIKLLGGEITVQSEEGKGSIFSISVPFIRLKPEETHKPRILIEKERKDKLKVKILIAEDELSNFNLLQVILKSTDYLIVHAKDGHEAIEICKSDPEINIVLMDIQMPKIDGFEATKEIIKIRPGLPVIAQTAYAHPSDRTRSLESGCVEYVSKPFSKEQILSLIEKYI
ncbi:MAG: response regulator [Chitinispirillaceae bacterium]|nr:response regulator [Chitinispirillaceae bacterium]